MVRQHTLAYVRCKPRKTQGDALSVTFSTEQGPAAAGFAALTGARLESGLARRGGRRGGTQRGVHRAPGSPPVRASHATGLRLRDLGARADW